MDASDRSGGNDPRIAILLQGSTIYRDQHCRMATGRREEQFNWTYGSMMKTLEASVKFKATPPAFRDTKKTSTSVLFMKNSMDFWR